MAEALAKSKKKRVTLTLDPEVHAEATRIARARGVSFSGLVEGLLAEQSEQTPEQWVQSLKVDLHAVDAPTPGVDPLYDAVWAKHGSGPHPGGVSRSEEAA